MYICPQGHELPYRLTNRSMEYREYRRDSCAGCPALAECVKGKKPYRRLCRSFQEELMVEMKERMESAEGRTIYGKRKTIIEPRFGHIKKNLGFEQFNLRGRNGAEIEWLMLCMGINIRKIGKVLGKLLTPGGTKALMKPTTHQMA